MFKLRSISIYLCLILSIFITACAPAEPVLPPDAVEKAKNVLGYALAPTYLPKEFDFLKTMPTIVAGNPPPSVGQRTTTITQVYEKDVFGEIIVYISMSYPTDAGKTDSSFMEHIGLLGLQVPEDAISEISINDMTAYLYHGCWSTDTLNRIARLELPINPEWDYDNYVSIRFAIDLPDNEIVWVRLATMRPTDKVDADDLIKIASSVVVVE